MPKDYEYFDGFLRKVEDEEWRYLLENAKAEKQNNLVRNLFHGEASRRIDEMSKEIEKLTLISKFRQAKIKELLQFLIDESDRVDEFVKTVSDKLVDKYSESLNLVLKPEKIEQSILTYHDTPYLDKDTLIRSILFDKIEVIYRIKYKGETKNAF